jgi:hypothetical protein
LAHFALLGDDLVICPGIQLCDHARRIAEEGLPVCCSHGGPKCNVRPTAEFSKAGFEDALIFENVPEISVLTISVDPERQGLREVFLVHFEVPLRELVTTPFGERREAFVNVMEYQRRWKETLPGFCAKPMNHSGA